MNKYITLTEENLATEHLCCALGDKKHIFGVEDKKTFLSEKLKCGHTFRKLDAKGKIFIEYEPLKTAFVPVEGYNFIYIYCLWVSGSFAGHGYANELLNSAISEAKSSGKSGLCVLSAKKKKPFLADKAFFIKYGFAVADTILDYELLYLSFDGSKPKFSDSAKTLSCKNDGLVIYYSLECPFVRNCIKEVTETAEELNIKLTLIRVDNRAQALELTSPFNNWAVFIDGKFATHHLLNKNMLVKLLSQK